MPTAVLLSIILHVIAVAIFLWASTASGQSQAITHEVSTDEEVAEDPPAEPLGIDESEAETLTWIGYEEYAEHLARLSEVEQAAMSTAPTAGGGGSPAASNPSVAVARAAAPAIPMSAQPAAAAPAMTVPNPETELPEILIDPEVLLDEKIEPTVEPEPVDSKTTEESSTSETEATPDPTTTPDEQTTTKDETKEEETKDDAAENVEPESPTEENPPIDPSSDPAPKPSPEPTPTPQPSPEPKPEPAESDGEGDGEGEGPGEPAAEPGNDADKDAEATSLTKVPASEWKQGKPLAAQGLNIRTRRPNIPLVSWLSYQPQFNPVARIEFDRTGKPVRAMLIVKSGEDRLDENLTDMLYRWRASGTRLTELTGNETVTIELQLLLN
ncbi:MAG: hypothetical protein QMB94_09705 [Phycisphaerales bacterium]